MAMQAFSFFLSRRSLMLSFPAFYLCVFYLHRTRMIGVISWRWLEMMVVGCGKQQADALGRMRYKNTRLICIKYIALIGGDVHKRRSFCHNTTSNVLLGIEHVCRTIIIITK